MAGKRRYNPNRAKIHRTYTVEEIAELYGVHKHTVRNWINGGLPLLDDRRPCLVHGTELRAFLNNRRRAAKKPCPPDHFYCLRCRQPRRPAGDIVEYLPITETSGNLRGICPTCDALIHRRIAWARRYEVGPNLEITTGSANHA